MGELTERDMRWLRHIWEDGGGKAWEPSDPYHPFLGRAISAGYLRRTDGRCGFERFKDSMVTWTDAGRAAMREGGNDA